MRLGVDAPTDVLLGAVLGVTVPLLGLRLFAPRESFPVVYGGAHGAHLDLGGARGEAIRRALKDQMGIEVSSVEPFGLAGSGGSSPMRLRRAGPPGRYLFGKPMRVRTCARTAGTRPAVAAVWPARGRAVVQGRPPPGPAGGLRAAPVPGRRAAEPGAVRLWWNSHRTGGALLLYPVLRRVRRSWVTPTAGDAVIDDGLLIVRRMPGTRGWPTVTSNRPTCWSATATCC